MLRTPKPLGAELLPVTAFFAGDSSTFAALATSRRAKARCARLTRSSAARTAGKPNSTEPNRRRATTSDVVSRLRAIMPRVPTNVRTMRLTLVATGFALAGLAAGTSLAPASDRPAPPRISGPRTASSPAVYRFSAHERGISPTRLRYRCAVDSQKLHSCKRVIRIHARPGRHTLRAQTVDPRGRRSAVTRIKITIRLPAPGEVTTIPVGNQPINTAYGADAVWVANYGDSTLSRIDPATNRSTLHMQLGAAPYGVAFGAGAVWLTTDFGGGTVFRVDPATNGIVSRIPIGGTPTGLAFGDGSVWVANRDGSVERIDPAAGAVVARTVLGRPAIAVAVGLGSVWVTTEDGAVFQLSSSTAALVGGAIEVGGDVDEVTVGPDAVWAASLTGRTVARIEPSTQRIVGRFSPGGQASGVIYADGALWVSLYDSKRVRKLDPQSGQVVKTLTVGFQPRGFTTGAGSVWVSNQGSGTVGRFAP